MEYICVLQVQHYSNFLVLSGVKPEPYWLSSFAMKYLVKNVGILFCVHSIPMMLV